MYSTRAFLKITHTNTVLDSVAFVDGGDGARSWWGVLGRGVGAACVEKFNFTQKNIRKRSNEKIEIKIYI